MSKNGYSVIDPFKIKGYPIISSHFMRFFTTFPGHVTFSRSAERDIILSIDFFMRSRMICVAVFFVMCRPPSWFFNKIYLIFCESWADDLRWWSHDDSVCRNISVYERIGTYNNAVSDSHSSTDDGIDTDPDIMTDDTGILQEYHTGFHKKCYS